MKKLLVLLMAIVLVMPAYAFAATTLVVTGDERIVGLSGEPEIRKITYLLTYDATPTALTNIALCDIPIADGTKTCDRGGRFEIGGWWLFQVDYDYNATELATNSDLRIWSINDRIDILGGTGENALDTSTAISIFPANVSRPLTGDELFDVSGNTTASATGDFVIWLYK